MEEKKKTCVKKPPIDIKKLDDEQKEDLTTDVPVTKHHMGIPKATFLEDIDAYMALPENDNNAEKVLRRLDEQHSKYKFMEYSLTAKKRRLKTKIPDFQKSVEMIHILLSNKAHKSSIDTHFLLSDQVYMKATIPPTDKVFLWLGADVMLEYDLEDAMMLLKKSMTSARKNLEIIESDLDYLRDQCTTIQVNRARVFNWDVKRNESSKA